MPFFGEYHVELLSAEMQRRKVKNARYSLRAFAQFLEMEPSALCRILGGKQPLSLRAAKKVVEVLSLTGPDRQRFLESVVSSLMKRAESFLNFPEEPRTTQGSTSGGLSGSKVETEVKVSDSVPIYVDPNDIGEIQDHIRIFATSLQRMFAVEKGKLGVPLETFFLRLMRKHDKHEDKVSNHNVAKYVGAEKNKGIFQ